jgi:hypothetical protein
MFKNECSSACRPQEQRILKTSFIHQVFQRGNQEKQKWNRAHLQKYLSIHLFVFGRKLVTYAWLPTLI